MPTYRIIVNGSNFHLEIDGKTRQYGFFQTVFIEARDPTQAELSALNLVRTSHDLKDLIKNDVANPPKLVLDSISEVATSEVPQLRTQGRSLYAE